MRLILTLAAPLAVLMAAGNVQAAATSAELNSVLDTCSGAAGVCASAVSDFAAGRADADRDIDLLNLANALALKSGEAPDACIEYKAGIDAAAGAASAAAQAQIAGVGAPLCNSDTDSTPTGSITRDYVTPQSLIDPNIN